MSRPTNPHDNASWESFLKTLNREEIYATTYRDLEHLRTNMAALIDQYHNRIRLHSALYRSLEEFERTVAPAQPVWGGKHAVFQTHGGLRAQKQ